MGTCKYCGQSIGLFSHAHKECEEKHKQGITDFTAILKSYFVQRASATEIQRSEIRLQKDTFLSEEDICNVSDTEIRAYTASIHRPFSPSSMKLMDEFLHTVGVSYSKINRNGAVDEFTKKLMKGFMVEYFTGQLALPTAHLRCEKVLGKFPMSQSEIEDAYLYVLNKAATNFLANGILSDDEQQKIDNYVHYLSLPVNNLPVQYRNSEISKISQVSIIKNVQNGIIPNTAIVAPVMLGKKESILWTYNDISLYQEKITKEWIGRSGGFSFRVFKGVYYRTGQMKSHPVEHSSMEFQGNGSLYVTNKNLIFYSQMKSVKVPFNKIVGITPYSDGIEVHKDGANTKRITMQGFDPWFIINLLSQVSNF
jgi:hypothetical protein